MKVTAVRSRVVDLPLEGEFKPAWMRGDSQSSFVMTLIEVDTDEGITGIGAADAGIEAAVAIDRFVAPHLIGRDPMEIERLTGVLKDAEIMAPPVYCVELCLWDIVGKMAGLPVYKLWGGHKDRVPAYCATGELRSPERRAEDVRALAAEGFRGVKLRFHRPDPRDDIAVVEAVRDAVGGDVELMVDANQAGVLPGIGGHERWNFQVALSVAREIERLGVLWLEEPLSRHDYAGLARLRDRLDSLARGRRVQPRHPRVQAAYRPRLLRHSAARCGHFRGRVPALEGVRARGGGASPRRTAHLDERDRPRCESAPRRGDPDVRLA